MGKVFFNDSKIKFICGLSKCKFHYSILVVSGRYIPLKIPDVCEGIANYSLNSILAFYDEILSIDCHQDLKDHCEQAVYICKNVDKTEHYWLENKLYFVSTVTDILIKLNKLNFSRKGTNYRLKKN